MKLRLLLLFFCPFIMVLGLAVQSWFFVSLIFNVDRAVAIVLSLDRTGNATMGQGNETISSWAGRKNSWMEPWINRLFEALGQGKNHCDRARESICKIA